MNADKPINITKRSPPPVQRTIMLAPFAPFDLPAAPVVTCYIRRVPL